LELDSIELAAAIFGSGDQNIHLLEKEFRVTAVCRGSVLRFTGEQKDVDAAARAVDGMVTLMENHTPLEEQTVRYCISLALKTSPLIMKAQDVLGKENLKVIMQGEYDFTMGIKGYQFKDGVKSPTDVQIATAANWTRIASSVKDTAGVQVIFGNKAA
jgi:phosphate starvation-inducible protein PhoH